MKKKNAKMKYILGIVLLLAAGALLVAIVLPMREISFFGDRTVRSEVLYLVMI